MTRIGPSAARRALRRPVRAAIGALLVLTLAAPGAAALASEPGAQITGRIADEYGQPLAQILVTETGRGQAVRTGANGRFTLAVPPGRRLTVKLTDPVYRVYPALYLGGTTAASAAKVAVPAGQRLDIGTLQLSMTARPRRAASAIKTTSKAAVRSAYRSYRKDLLARQDQRKPKGCKAPATSAAAKKRTLAAVNYMRSMAGLDKVRYSAAMSKKASASSLIQYYRGTLSHSPPASATCSTAAGRAGAAASNLARGPIGPKAVRAYMADPGARNTDAGHRRWLLAPDSKYIGTGDVGAFNSLLVAGPAYPDRARPRWIPWPGAGYFPVQEEPKGRWSLSASRPDVSFARARVSARLAGGKKLRVTTYRATPGPGPATVVFAVRGLPKVKGTGQVTVRVTISGITQRGVRAAPVAYTVRLFNPMA